MDSSVFHVSRAGCRIAAEAKTPPTTGVALHAQLVADFEGQLRRGAEEPWVRRWSGSRSGLCPPGIALTLPS